MEPETQPSKDHFLPVSILLAAVMISGSIIYLVKHGGGLPPEPARLGGGNQPTLVKVSVNETKDVILGDPQAPVTLIEYGDYQCPFCGKFFSETELTLRQKYIQPGKVKMVFRDFAFLGPESIAAAAAAGCAKDQRKFWEYHDLLYTTEIKDSAENNGNLTRDLFIRLADQLKLDAAAFTTCLDSKKYDAEVEESTKSGQSFGVGSTPTTFVNGKMVTDSMGRNVGANGNAIFQAVEAALQGK